MAREMVYQNYNHPSMVAWAYMNEVLLDNTPWQNGDMSKEEYYQKVTDCAGAIDSALRESDPSRPTMIPCDGDRKKYKESGLGKIPDILGFNLYHGWYYSSFDKLGSALDKIHDTFPGKALIVSEYGADADSRLHSFEPECQDYTCDYALLYHKSYIPVIFEKEYLSGGAVWNLNDFHSEARGFAVPHFNCKGITTSDRTPKDSYWLYKALLGNGSFIRIGGTDWKIRGGQEEDGKCIQPVEVFASAQEVELSLNGQSLGSKAVKDGSAIFDVPFIDGENVLEAHGSDGSADLLRIDFRMIPEDMSKFREISVLMGTRRYFEDRSGGQIWIPEQEYRPGLWGYIGGERMYQQNSGGPRPAFDADIIGTDLDPLFQTQRAGLDAFRADVPDGRYFVYLYFADLTGPFRGKPMLYDIGNETLSSGEAERVFSVSINGTTVLSEVNIAQEYGYNTAVVQRFPVEVEGGSGLVIGFFKSKGIPVLNAIRIIRVQ
jgi:beta-galactosidase